MNNRTRSRTALLLLPLFLLALCLSPAAAAKPQEAPDRDLSPLPESWFDDAVFIGDSITNALRQVTEACGGLGEAQFLSASSYGVRNAVAGTLKLWYRGAEYFPWEVLPLTGAGKVFFLLGANDVGREGGIDAAMDSWTVLYDRLREECPDLRIYIQSQLPVWHEIRYVGLNNENLLVYNERLKAFCGENGCVYVDVADFFRDEYGGLAERYTSDYYVHINVEAAQLWIEELKNPANYSEDPRLGDAE